MKAWSPFFTGVDTRVVAGYLHKPGPGALSDLDGPFGRCEQTLLFERRR